jgi:hypothetical protein
MTLRILRITWKEFSSDKLDKMFNVQKLHCDKSSLGYVDNCSSLLSTSNEKSDAKGKVVFVNVVVDEGKKVACDNGVSKPKSFPSPRR